MFNRINRLISKYSDIALAVAVVSIVGIMVIRISPMAIDYLLAANILVAATILMTALYIRDASRLPSFPTILLLTTLFRLGLNVSTTRLILLEADAGRIIFAFGDFVVMGNFVVGAVIFLVLVLVQFVVIAKGSERVAEVSARFSLDAMQGKQMAIDNDFRNGVISPEESRIRRQALDRESRLYGAMDGAMKFVKGDAIAGILISLVNIVGGLIIGVVQQGMTAGEAAETYALLTIGDGLVSQIPALLISVSAGLVVTRVAANEDEQGHLASDLLTQFLAHGRALMLAAGLAFILGASSPWTGFPVPPFLILGAVLAVAALPGLVSREAKVVAGVVEEEKELEEAPEVDWIAPVPLSILIHRTLETIFLPDHGEAGERIKSQARLIRQQFTRTYGVRFPAIQFGRDSRKLPQNGYSINIYGAPVGSATIAPTQVLAFCDVEVAKEHGADAVACPIPWDHRKACHIPVTQLDLLLPHRITLLTAEQVVWKHVRVVLRRHAADFIGVQEISDLLEELKTTHAELVKSVTPVLMTAPQITEVVKALLNEQVPIRDFRLILESLARWGSVHSDVPHLVAAVRRDLRRVISDAFSSQTRLLPFVAVSREIEQLIGQRIVEHETGLLPALGTEESRSVLTAVTRAMAPARRDGVMPVLMTTGPARRHVRSVLQPHLPDTPVICYDEIAPEFEVMQVGYAELES